MHLNESPRTQRHYRDKQSLSRLNPTPFLPRQRNPAIKRQNQALQMNPPQIKPLAYCLVCLFRVGFRRYACNTAWDCGLELTQTPYCCWGVYLSGLLLKSYHVRPEDRSRDLEEISGLDCMKIGWGAVVDTKPYSTFPLIDLTKSPRLHVRTRSSHVVLQIF